MSTTRGGWAAAVFVGALVASLLAVTPVAEASSRGFTAEVTVSFRLDVDGKWQRLRVSCPERRSKACGLLKRHPHVLWPDPQRLCTAEYAGPERARIRGVVNGRTVDVVITRADGCGMSDWKALAGLLPAR